MTWKTVAKNNHGFIINIEVICSDKKEHRNRIETRLPNVENLKPPTWKDVANRIYHSWDSERIIIDTANKPIEECQKELDIKIHSYLELNGAEFL